MQRDGTLGRFVEAIKNAASLLENMPATEQQQLVPTESLPSLLEQCNALCEKARREEQEPVRTIHHFACTGGTLISKCIAAMPGVYLLSEVDPLSSLGQKGMFRPTDIIGITRLSSRGAEPELLIDLFLAALEVLYHHTVSNGMRLVLRDHAHSHFCVEDTIAQRTSLLEIIGRRFKTRSVVTVRHPLDSYLSLVKNSWLHFSPQTLEEYSVRYLEFLNRHDGWPIVKYEKFVSDPIGTAKHICEELQLPFNEGFEDLFNIHQLSGDSGRKGDVIQSRPRRKWPASLDPSAADSNSYKQLLSRLGYN